MLKFAIVELQRIDLVWAIPLLALVHLAWLIQGARVLAMLLTGNWDGKPMVYPRLLALLRRRKASKSAREQGVSKERKDLSG